ncbi:hypothetical protein [Streptomyces sp. NPDC002537]
MHTALDLAVHAQRLAEGHPCAGAALAAPIEARAHALLGHRSAATEALGRAADTLRNLPSEERIESVFGYTEGQYRFHAGNIWKCLQDTARARAEHQHALELFPPEEDIYRPLIRLDYASCLAFTGDIDGALETAVGTLATLSDRHRTNLVVYRGRALSVSPGQEASYLLEQRVVLQALTLTQRHPSTEHFQGGH